MGGSGAGLDSGGGSRGASFGGRGMRAMFRPCFGAHHKPTKHRATWISQ